MSKIGRNDPCPCGSGNKYKACCGAPASLDISDLKQHLVESFEFLMKSSISFDSGDKAEAKRIALEIRKLVYDPPAGKSKSILTSLERKQISFIESGYEYHQDNLFPHLGLVIMHFPGGVLARLNSFGSGARRVDFEKWWSSIIISDMEKQVFSRSDIVLCLANQDGGAHADDNLERDYFKLTREDSLGLKYVSDGVEYSIDIHFSSVRQIAHEIVLTLLEAMPELRANRMFKIYYNHVEKISIK